MGQFREFCMVCIESSYGTAKASPVLGTDKFYIPLPNSNSLSAESVPSMTETPWGGGLDVLGDVTAGSWGTTGKLQTLGYPALTAILLKAAITRSDGSSVPWTNTEPAGDLASVSIYHGWKYRSGTAKRRRLAGGKIAGVTLECSKQDPRLKATYDFVWQKEVGNSIDSSTDPDATEFPEPTDSQMPLGTYKHQHLSGNLSLAATPLVGFNSVSLKIANKLDPQPFEGYFPLVCGFYGRETTLDAELQLKASPDLFAQLQAITMSNVTCKWSNGVNSAQINMGGRCHLTGAPRDFRLGQEFLQKATWKSAWDPALNVDLVLTTT